MIKRYLRLLLVIPFLALIFGLANTEAAQAGDSSLTGTKYISVDYDSIKMCHNWSSNTCGTTAGNKLFIYQSNSNYWRCTKARVGIGCPTSHGIEWNDTDGFYLPHGWKIATNVMGIPTGWVRYGDWPGTWRKVGDCGCWKAIKRYPR